MATKRKNSATAKKNSSRVKRKVTQSDVESAFEGAFGHIDPKGADIASEQVEVRADRNNNDIAFNTVLAAVEEDNDNDEDTNNKVEEDTVVGGDDVDHNVGFGNADDFDVNDILELSGNIQSSSDIIQYLKENCIYSNSKSTYKDKYWYSSIEV